VPPELDAIVHKALQRDPARRYQSAKEMAIALDAVLTEIARIEQHGFSEGELARVKKDWKRLGEWWDQREKTGSEYYANQCQNNFLRDDPIMNQTIERELYDRLASGITVDDVNRVLDDWFANSSRAILVSAPEKEGVSLPRKEALRAVFDRVARKEAPAFVDDFKPRPLLAEKPRPGRIVKETKIPELGLTVTTCNINTWTNPRFRLGGVCNPDPALRREALAEFHKAIEICKRLDVGVVGFWPGSDGADYHFQIDYLQSLEWFTEALVSVNQACLEAGVRLAVEPKPYEPRELYMIVPTAASAILVAARVNRECGGTNCGLTVDYGHQKMEATTAATACDLAAYAGVPIHKFDVNDARQGRNDQDLIFGTVSIPEAVEYLFTTFERDYRGWYSQDQFTYRDDPVRAMERSMVNFANIALKAVRLYARRDELAAARAAGTGPDLLDLVSPLLLG